MKNLLLLLISLFSLCASAQSYVPGTVHVMQLPNVSGNSWLLPPVGAKIPNEEEFTEENQREISRNMPVPDSILNKVQQRGMERQQESPRLQDSPQPFATFPGGADNNTSIPPDVMGAAGPNHLFCPLNNIYTIQNKSGVIQTAVAPTSFWSGITPGGHADPRIYYNTYINRWILIAQSNLDANSSVLVAISQTTDPTGAWYRYAIRADQTGASGFDYPYVGYNQNWLVITGNMFSNSTGSFTGTTMFILDIATLAAGGTITIGTNAQQINNSGGTQGSSICPVVVQETGTPSTTMYTVQNWNGTSGAVRLVSLSGTIPSVTWNTGSAVYALSAVTWSNSGSASLSFSPQKDDERTLQANDARIGNAIMVNGKIWFCHTVFLPLVAPTRSAIQWMQVQTNGTVLQQGRIDDATGSIHRTFPSLAVNTSEDVVVGYKIFSRQTYPSAAYSTRKSCTAAGNMMNEVVYKSGTNYYYRTYSAGRPRWGDYSQTCIDPSTGRFWTVQQYATAPAGTGDQNTRWGTQWAEIDMSINNSVQFSINEVSVSEKGTTGSCPSYSDYTFSVVPFCAATGNATLTFNTVESAIQSARYTITPASVSFTNGDNAAKTFTVRIYDDLQAQTSQKLSITYTISGTGVIAGPDNQMLNINITDDDAGTPTAASASYSGSVGAAGTSSNFLFRGSFAKERAQMIYSATELTNAGLKAGPLTKLGFFLSSKASTAPYNNLNIALKLTTSSSFAVSGTSFQSGMTNVYSGNYSTVAGWNDFTFSSPFNWDGTSNIIVELCYDNTSGTSDDFVQATSSEERFIYFRNSTGSGCGASFGANSFMNTNRPDIRFFGTQNSIAVQTAATTISNVNLGPFADVYVYNGSNVLARIQNNTAFDYGCSQLLIDRTGTGTSAFWNNNLPNYLANKTFRFLPANTNPTGSYTVTLYYTQAEVSGWQTLTGNSWSQARVVKSPAAISAVTPSSSTSGISVDYLSTPGTYGNDYTLKGSFTTGFGGFGAGDPGGTPLPVTLLEFDAKKVNKTVELNWSTAFEHLSERFDVEVSRDGIQFNLIGNVKAAGESTQLQRYKWIDQQPQNGINYYRLKQWDKDGQFTLSKTLAISFEGRNHALVIYPNPARTQAALHFDQPYEKVEIQVYTMDGSLIYRNSYQQVQRTVLLSVSSWPSGTYTIEARAGSSRYRTQLIKE